MSNDAQVSTQESLVDDLEQELAWFTANRATATSPTSLPSQSYAPSNAISVHQSAKSTGRVFPQFDQHYDWDSAFQSPPLWLENETSSVYSDGSTRSRSDSPALSTSSMDTAGPLTPHQDDGDVFDGEGSITIDFSALSEGFQFGLGDPWVTSSLPLSMSPIEMETPEVSLGASLGQPQQQFLPGIVAAAVRDEVRLQADIVSPLTSQDPGLASTSSHMAPLAPTAPGTPVNASSKRHGTARDGDNDDDLLTTKPNKRARKQSTKKTLVCPHCGSHWPRSHNLKVHIRSVHEGERPYACLHPDCDRVFSRNHDAKRHFQSEHTTLGSPRKKPATK
ncbi:hypothetical protein FKP32DRAFT_1589656 [Trametes sanguinea]|nr:hypothetical protein FKP32DRAFT_1589656 [Trametes sanguinea]